MAGWELCWGGGELRMKGGTCLIVSRIHYLADESNFRHRLRTDLRTSHLGCMSVCSVALFSLLYWMSQLHSGSQFWLLGFLVTRRSKYFRVNF